MQNGQLEITWLAPVRIASSERTWFTRRSPISSCHMLPPPAPQQSPLLRLRGISVRLTPGTISMICAAASYTLLRRPR
jgi:hypothetical protein